jgi:signal transduction histidine kinase
MHGNMMNMMQDLERDVFEINDEGSRIGYLVILRSGDITETETVDLFKMALRRGTMISGILAIITGFFITNLLSRFLSKDLKKTSKYAADISEDKNIQIEKSKIKEIKDIQNTLKELSTRLKLKEKIRREKADKITHEARTPITILRTNIEGILDGVIEMDKDRLETCSKELENLTKIVENIDGVLTVEDEKELIHEEFNLSSELKKIISGMDLQFKNKNIKLEKNIEEGLIVNTDRGLIAQSIYNILTNAYKYTKKYGKVRIELYKNEEIILKISNSIYDTEEVNIERIFEPYFRGENSKGREGEGLGLYIAKTNLEKIGAKIYAARDEEEIKFTLEL